MFARTLIAATVLAGSMATMFAMPGEAKAGVSVDIGVGTGRYYDPGYDGGWYDDGYDGYDGYDGGYRRPPPVYRPYPPVYRPYPPPPPYYGEDTQWFSCSAGKQLLRDRGFYNIRTDNCKGPNYRYRAFRNGREFDIRMDTSGYINRIKRIN